MPTVERPRRILINAWGSMGDVVPFLALGQGLARVGAQVTILSSANCAAAVAAAGLGFESVGSRDAYERALADPALWDPERGQGLIDALFDQTTAQLRSRMAEAARGGPSLFIAGTRGVRARAQLSGLGVPIVGVYLAPEIFLADKSENKLGLFPAWFAGGDADELDAGRMTGFVLVDGEPESEAVLARLQGFLRDGPPPLAFTFGTAMKHGERLFGAALDACRRLNRRAVFLSRFPGQVPADLDASQFLHLDYVPLRRLLPSVAALVFHGGVGTCAQALSAGCPQLVVPLAHDQHANAARVKALGVGDAVSSADLDGAKLAEVLQRTMSDPAIKKACEQYARQMRDCDGLQAAVDWIDARLERTVISTASVDLGPKT